VGTVWRPAPRPRITQQALAERLHVSRDQVRYGLEEVHRQFIEFLRAEVADQVGPDGDLDTEIRELQALLGD
jgi:DNA-binding transcriptional regulator LsrR (DeoR family)